MAWLIAQMWGFLLIAFALGAASGVWAYEAKRQTSEPRRPPESPEPAAEPVGLLNVPDGQKDDLTQIIGIDAKTESQLNALGVFHLGQIASWDNEAARWIESRLNATGRVARERWIDQASSIRQDF